MQTKTSLHFSCPCSVSSDIVTRMWHKIILYIANVILEYKPQVHMHMQNAWYYWQEPMHHVIQMPLQPTVLK